MFGEFRDSAPKTNRNENIILLVGALSAVSGWALYSVTEYIIVPGLMMIFGIFSICVVFLRILNIEDSKETVLQAGRYVVAGMAGAQVAKIASPETPLLEELAVILPLMVLGVFYESAVRMIFILISSTEEEKTETEMGQSQVPEMESTGIETESK